MHTDERQEQALLDLLKDYPMPKADEDFYDRALAKAALDGRRKQRRGWMAAGFGSAVAAGLAAWMVFGFLLGTPDVTDDRSALPGVSIALAEPRTVNLVFASNETLDNALLTVVLPVGVELDGFPGQREITWETSLAEGRNLLPLTLVATSAAGGEVLATLKHNNRDQTFRLVVTVS